MIFVSHDRYFINALAGKVLAIGDGKAIATDGNYDDYRAALPKEMEAAPVGTTSGRAASQKEQRRRQAEQRQAVSSAEKRIEALEAEMSSLNETIAAAASDYETLQGACARLEEVTAAYEEALAEWMELDDGLGGK